VDGETVFEWDPDADGASDVDNRTLYAGYHLDTETGLYSVRHRYYHPTLGRWIGREVRYRDGLSLYEYVGSNTLVRVDPTGMFLDTPQRVVGKAARVIERVGKAAEAVIRAVDAISEGVARVQETVREAEDTAEQVVEDVRNLPSDLASAAIQKVRSMLCKEGIEQMENVDETLRREAEGYEQMAQNLENFGNLAERTSEGTSGSSEPYSTEIGIGATLYSEATNDPAGAMRELAASARSPETKREYMREICEYLIIPYCCPDEAEKHCAQFMGGGE